MKTGLVSVLAFLVLAAAARAAQQIPVVVVPAGERFPAGGAIGLFVPGDGTTTSGESAYAALVRGKTRKSVLGGAPAGKPLIRTSTRPGPVTIYVSLPPPGTRPNTKRYPIAIVGDGWHGILRSPSTRIRGLVSIADIAPTALGKDRITASRDPDARAHLQRLDTRLRQQHDSRNWAVAILALSVLAGSLVALWSRSRGAARAAILAAPVTVAVAVVLSAAGAGRPVVLVLLLAGIVAAVCVGGAVLLRNRKVVAALFVALIAAYLVVLAARPEWTALAAIGPNPSEGGRFYGSSNITTTVLVTVALYAASALGLRWVAVVGLLAAVTVGWSKAGADGGGLVVVVAAFATLGLLLARGRMGTRNAILVGVGAAALALALVGVDAATGGHSHVTRRVGEGPGALVDEVGNRLHISVERITTSWHAALVFGLGVAALAVLATRRPRFAAGDALLLATVVSLIVNDSPSDVVSGAAISYGVLWTYERVHSRAWHAAR